MAPVLPFNALASDLRFAARMLRSSPSFALAAIASLALGIGATTAVFSIADAVFLRPLPYAQPQRLLWVGTRFPSMTQEFLSSPDYVEWRRDNRSLEYLAATQVNGSQPVLLNGSEPEQLDAVRVSANF